MTPSHSSGPAAGHAETIQSYVVQPFPGYEQQTAEALAGIPGCEVLPAQNRPAFVLVTETHGRAEQRELEERVAALAGLAAISLVSGWTDTEGVEEEPV